MFSDSAGEPTANGSHGAVEFVGAISERAENKQQSAVSRVVSSGSASRGSAIEQVISDLMLAHKNSGNSADSVISSPMQQAIST